MLNGRMKKGWKTNIVHLFKFYFLLLEHMFCWLVSFQNWPLDGVQDHHNSKDLYAVLDASATCNTTNRLPVCRRWFCDVWINPTEPRDVAPQLMTAPAPCPSFLLWAHRSLDIVSKVYEALWARVLFLQLILALFSRGYGGDIMMLPEIQPSYKL